MNPNFSSILIFQRGSSQDLKAALSSMTPPVILLVLCNETTDHIYVPLVLEAFPSDQVVVLNQVDFLPEKDLLPYLDDYIKGISQWSLEKSKKTGKNLREALAFQNEISAWWFLPITEKATFSRFVDVYKSIFFLSEQIAISGKPKFAGFVGTRDLQPAYRKIFKDLGVAEAREFTSSEIEVTAPGTGSTPGFSLLNFCFILGQWIFSAFKSGRENPVVVLSEYPSSWVFPKVGQESSGPTERYLEATMEQLTKRYPGEVNLALTMHQHGLRNTQFASDVYRAREVIKAHRLKKRGAVHFVDFWRKRDHKKIAQFASQVSTSVKTSIEAGEFGKICYRDVDLTRFFSTWIDEGMRASVPSLLADGLKLARYFRSMKPKVCIFRNEFYATGRLVSWAAAKAGVSSLSVQHGIFSPTHGLYRFDHSEVPENLSRQNMVATLPFPNKFGVWGAWFQRAFLSSASIGEAAVPTIGAQRIIQYEMLKKKLKLNNQETIRKKLELPDTSFVLLFITQYAPVLNTVHIALEAARKHPLRPLIVFKPHPQRWINESIRNLVARYEDCGHRFIDEDLESLFSACDAVITANSTAGFEALAMDKPLLVIPNPATDGYFDFGLMDHRVVTAFDVKTCYDSFEKIKNLCDRPQLAKQGAADEVLGLHSESEGATFLKVVNELISAD